MKKLKKISSIILAIVLLLSSFSIFPLNAVADVVEYSTNSNQAISCKENGSYTDVAFFGRKDYVPIDSSKTYYYKVDVDSEIFAGATAHFRFRSVDTGSITEKSFAVEKAKDYSYVQYIPLDLSSGYGGRLEITPWLVLANGQKIYGDDTVRVDFDKIIASGKCGENLNWTLNRRGRFYIDGTGEMDNFNSYGKNCPWAEYRQQIEDVRIGEGVTSIGSYAFYGVNKYSSSSPKVDSIVNVDLPSTLAKIGVSAFGGCVSLQSIILPDSVTTLGNFAFDNCKSLSNVKLSNEITVINNSTFEDCTSLKSIELPESLEAIKYNAFSGSGLTYITINKNVKYIANRAFSYCNSLVSVNIKGNIALEGYVFASCSSLESVTFNGKIYAYERTPYSSNGYDGHLFENCPKLCDAKLPSYIEYRNSYDSTDEIKIYPIQSLSNFEGSPLLNFSNIQFNDNPQIIDGVVFTSDGKTLLWYPNSLQDSSYDIPDGVETLAFESFENQKYLKHIYIPSSVKKLEGRVFQNCVNLNNVIIPNGVTELFDFQNCTSLKSIYIPNTVTKMYQSGKSSMETFQNCEDLTIYCDKNSYAETFAMEYSFNYKIPVYCYFDANGGNLEYNKQVVIPNDRYWKLPSANKTNSDFLGWFASPSGGESITKDSTVNQEESFNLYACWKNNTSESKKIFFVNKILNNVTTNNDETKFKEMDTYQAVLKPIENYKITYVSVKMNNKDVKVQYNESICIINIQNVTSDISIIVTATRKDEPTTDPFTTIPTSTVELPTMSSTTSTESSTSSTTNPTIPTTGSTKPSSTPTPPKPTPKKSQTITAKSYTKVYGSKAFNLGAKAKTKLSYKSSDKKVVTVSANGKITIKGVGKATITITASANSSYKSATRKITIIVNPKSVSRITYKVLKSHTVQLNWSKVSGIKEYEVNFSYNKNFSGSGTIKKSEKSNTRKYKGFNKNVYIRIRTVKKYKGANYYSAWKTVYVKFKK